MAAPPSRETGLCQRSGEEVLCLYRCAGWLAPLVTQRFGLEVDRAYELMDARAEGFVKAVLIP